MRLTSFGVIAAVLLCAAAAFAANPGVANRTTTGDTNFSAYNSFFGPRVSATLTASNSPGQARVVVYRDDTGGNFFGTAQVRCTATGSILADSFGGSDWFGQSTCSGNANAWAGTLQIN